MEIWKDIPNWEGYYQVSNTGLVKGLERQVKYKQNGLKWLKESVMAKCICRGYFHVKLRRFGNYKMEQVHRLVARAFLSNYRPDLQVNHKNGIKTDNRLENLEMCTASENQRHAYKLGLNKSKQGENSCCAKLKNEEVIIIKKLLKEGVLSQRKIAKLYSISYSTIWKIHKGITWMK